MSPFFAHWAALTLAIRSFASCDPLVGPVYFRAFLMGPVGISASGIQSERIRVGIYLCLEEVTPLGASRSRSLHH